MNPFPHEFDPLSRSELDYLKQRAGLNFSGPEDTFKCLNIRERLRNSIGIKGEEEYTGAAVKLNTAKSRKEKDKSRVEIGKLEKKILTITQADMSQTKVKIHQEIKEKDISDKRVLLPDGSKGRVDMSGWTLARGMEHVKLSDAFPITIKLDSGSIKTECRGSLKLLCEVCDKISKSRCGKCKNKHYCSRECQISDWKTHKKVCGK